MRFEQRALQATLQDYLAEVDHVAERIERLESAIDVAVETAPQMRELVQALQACGASRSSPR